MLTTIQIIPTASEGYSTEFHRYVIKALSGKNIYICLNSISTGAVLHPTPTISMDKGL